MRISTGETRSFDVLVERYQARLLNFVYRIVGDRERAEDLVQEVFVRVYRHLGRFDRSKKFSTWIYTIASNLAKNELRNRSRNPLVLFTSMTSGWEDEERPLEFEDPSSRPDDLFRKRHVRETGRVVGSAAAFASPGSVHAARDRGAVLRRNRGDHPLQLGDGEVASEPGAQLVRRDHRAVASIGPRG